MIIEYVLHLVLKLETKSFMNNSKRIMVITGAGSKCIDLHSKKNEQGQRHHITMEVGWSPEMLLQQLGISLFVFYYDYCACI